MDDPDSEDVVLRSVDESFRVVIPPSVRERFGLKADDYVAFEIDEDGVHLRKVRLDLEK